MRHIIFGEHPKGKYANFVKRYEDAFQLFNALLGGYEFVCPKPVDFSILRKVLDENYVNKLELIDHGKDLALKEAVYIDRIATAGTILATKLAFEGVSYNLGGGYHHAFRDRPGTYDYINDIAVATILLKKKVKKIMVIDLDVHHANGSQSFFWKDPRVFHISFHSENCFPKGGWTYEIGEGKGKGTIVNLPLPKKCSDNSYLYALDQLVGPLIRLYKPNFVLYQSGVDGHHKDPTCALSLTLLGLYERDKKIKEFAIGKPIAVVRGGGYNNKYSPKANVNTLAAFADKDIIFYESTINESRTTEKMVKQRIKDLKDYLSPYYQL